MYGMNIDNHYGVNTDNAIYLYKNSMKINMPY